MKILTAPLQIGTHNRGFSAQFPTKKGPGNLTPNTIPFFLGLATRVGRRGFPDLLLFVWELVDPVVADPVAQDDDKRNDIHIYIYTYSKAAVQ